jgi:hypothetical protein
LTSLPKNDAAKEALIRAAIGVWEGLEKVLNKLIESIGRRLKMVIEAGG